MVNNILKYRTKNLIILYYYVYSELLDIMDNVIWNSIDLIRSVKSDF